MRASNSSSTATAGTPAEFRVEIPQQRVLAAGGGGEIRRAVDDASPVTNTAATVSGYTDNQRPALATSSTPLPFQRNFTTLGKPMPPEYINATVSPVHCDGSMPLNP